MLSYFTSTERTTLMSDSPRAGTDSPRINPIHSTQVPSYHNDILSSFEKNAISDYLSACFVLR